MLIRVLSCLSGDIMKEIPNFGKEDCECKHCQAAKTNNPKKKRRLNHGPYLPADKLGPNYDGNRVPLPGDPDYDGR